ncbi:PD-(D/E)XK nuclease family protein [Mangrovibacter phragmitis]|uniref:PD-(D/E)XK nuclease family protein n=1 Tax=Pseudomonadati TaxID=3379134 RepID=UPI00336A0C29
MSELMTTTYSMWRLFRNCRMACKWRYIDELVPLERDPNLAFGSVIHDCLECWHGERDLAKVLDHIDRIYPNRAQDDHQQADWHLARAMMSAYAEHYPAEAFEVVALEKTFEGPIVNPATGATSRSFILAGKVDGIVRQDGQYFLLEHKTASQIDASYLERLWTDFQIILYAWYLEQTLGITVSGIIYNVLVKAKLRQGKGETEAEFEARRVELIAKSKTGKSSAKRKLPEDDETFQQRLQEKYLEPGMFHREVLYISRDQFEELRAELWELSKAMLDARRRDTFYRNTSYCFQYGRPCAYFQLCRSGGNPNVIENHFQRIAPHEELRDGAGEDAAPVF